MKFFEDTKATTKKLNAYIDRRIKELNLPGKAELAKGEGYFYVIYDDVPRAYETEDIYVYALNQASYEEWCKSIDTALDAIKERL